MTSAKAQLLAQVIDVYVDDVRFRIELVTPPRLRDARPRHRAARIAHEELEQGEFARREIDDALILHHAARQRIERDVPDLERRILVTQLGTTDECVDAREQL